MYSEMRMTACTPGERESGPVSAALPPPRAQLPGASLKPGSASKHAGEAGPGWVPPSSRRRATRSRHKSEAYQTCMAGREHPVQLVPGHTGGTKGHLAAHHHSQPVRVAQAQVTGPPWVTRAI